MGNRAVIKPVDSNISIYLHWNGGLDSVRAFLKYCELHGHLGMGVHSSYAVARLTQVISNFFGGSNSIGIVDCDGTVKSSYGDNGIYIVKGWEIIKRVDCHYEQDEYDLQEMLEEIDKAQPEKDQLGDYLRAEEIVVSELKLGDTVCILDDVVKTVKNFTVVDFGIDRVVNGININGLPIINYFEKETVDISNINNYITDKKVRVLRETKE